MVRNIHTWSKENVFKHNICKVFKGVFKRILLANIRDDFEYRFSWNECISIGKIDKNKEKAICFYPSKREIAKINTLGGYKNRSYNIKPITILLRYTNDQDVAEKMAQKIYDFYRESHFFIDKIECFTEMISPYPISLGTDDKNIYEYSIELNIFNKKEMR